MVTDEFVAFKFCFFVRQLGAIDLSAISFGLTAQSFTLCGATFGTKFVKSNVCNKAHVSVSK